jgi:hypothetical protein
VDVRIIDFRICDRVLAETEADAGDTVFLGPSGTTAYSFLIIRRLSGPGGVYIDACEIVDGNGASLGLWEKHLELDGESKPATFVSELRDVTFPGPGTYHVMYSMFDEMLADFPFSVVQRAGPGAGIVPGPLDAALSKSTIAWLAVAGAGAEKPVWYGYEDGRVYVLVGGDGEQQVPGLFEAGAVQLLARSKDKRSLVADVTCAVEKLSKDAEWDRIARDLLVGRRLNLTDGEKAVDRWKQTCEIACLTPVPPPAIEFA